MNMKKIIAIFSSFALIIVLNGCSQDEDFLNNSIEEDQKTELINDSLSVVKTEKDRTVIKDNVSNDVDKIEVINEEMTEDISIDNKFKALKSAEFLVLRNKLDGVLVDIRTSQEIAQKNIITTDLEIDYYSDNFKSELDKLNKDQSYFLYCAHGNRTRTTKNIMKEMGFREVYDLEGGIVTMK